MDEEGPGWHPDGEDVPWWVPVLVGSCATVVGWLVILLVLSLFDSGA